MWVDTIYAKLFFSSNFLNLSFANELTEFTVVIKQGGVARIY